MQIDWTNAAPSIPAAFLATPVGATPMQGIEAPAIMLAVGALCGWRSTPSSVRA